MNKDELDDIKRFAKQLASAESIDVAEDDEHISGSNCVTKIGRKWINAAFKCWIASLEAAAMDVEAK